MNWLYLASLLLICRLHSICAEHGNCFTLFNKCNARYNCFASLVNLKFLCHELLTGEHGSGCTQTCREAIKMVDDDKDGKHFLTCDCDRDSECLTYQARASKCLQNRTSDNNKIGCANFSRQCQTDEGCNTVMEKFFIQCTHLISGTSCTPTCEIVQEELYTHNITKGLLDCECSGTVKEENFCRGITAHTLHLCKTSPMVKKTEKEKNNGSLGDKENRSRTKLMNAVNTSSKSVKLGSEYVPKLIILLFTSRLFYEIANK